MPDLDRLAAGYPAVAFDVFDTLIHRDVPAPTQVFSWMESQGLAPAGFARARVDAEAQARALAAPREVTLQQIYARPALAGCSPEAELEAERRLCVADPAMQAFWQRCLDRGQRVYAVSDMYLSAAQIRTLLEGCGYTRWDGVFASSDWGVQKRSGGLFRVFLEQTGLKPGQVLFLGDDRRADQLGAALAGIRSLHTPGPAPRPAYLPVPATDAQGRMDAWLRNHAAFFQDDRQALGFSVLGPLAVGFAAWLKTLSESIPDSRLVFLARDMYLMQQACRMAGVRNTAYLRVSRRCLTPALLMQPQSPDTLELLADTLPRQVLTAKQILQLCGFSPDTSLPGCPADRRVDLHVRPLTRPVQQLLDQIRALSHTPAGIPVQQAAAAVQQYLQGCGLDRPGTILVDIGSGGTTQRILQTLCGGSLQGAYLACDSRLHQYLPADRARVYLFGGRPAPLWFWMSQPLLEYLISEPCGATVGYRQSDRGPVPVQEPVTPPADLLAIQKGIVTFVAQWNAGPHAGQVPGPEPSIAPFLAMARRPRLREAACLGDFTLEDGVRFRLAAPRPWGEYLTHPRRLIRDFADSRWKIGFFKRLFRLPLPYDQVYALLKGHR